MRTSIPVLLARHHPVTLLSFFVLFPRDFLMNTLVKEIWSTKMTINTGFLRITLIAALIARLSAAEFIVPNGTRLSARLEQTISSATAEPGQQVQLTLGDAVKVNGITVLPQGTPILGTVVMAEEKKTMGRRGKLDFSVDKVRAADGEPHRPRRVHRSAKEDRGRLQRRREGESKPKRGHGR